MRRRTCRVLMVVLILATLAAAATIATMGTVAPRSTWGPSDTFFLTGAQLTREQVKYGVPGHVTDESGWDAYLSSFTWL